MGLRHIKTSLKPDSSDPAIIQPSDWNNDHTTSEPGVLYSESTSAPIHGVVAGQNYFEYFRRKFNAHTREEYEFEPLEYKKNTDYIWSQVPVQSLQAGMGNLLILNPVPLGVNGTNINHKLYIEDGVSGNEVVTITGGTAISGAATGTILITPTFGHGSGQYSIKSATAGIQEAVNTLDSDRGGIVKIPTGTHVLQSQIFINKNNVKISGCGFYSTILQFTNTTDIVLINFDGSAAGSATVGNFIEYLTIRGNTATFTSYIQPAISVNAQVRFWGRYINISETGSGIRIVNNDNSDAITFENCWVANFRSNGIEILGSNSQNFNNVFVVSGQNVVNVGWLIKKTGGLVITGGCSFSNNMGVLIQPTGTELAAHMWFTNFVVDACSGVALKIEPHTGGLVSGLIAVNSYFTFSDTGVHINTEEADISHIKFIDCRINLNKKHGIVTIGSKVLKNFTISNCMIDSNGGEVTETYDGISIVCPANGLRIVNNDITFNPVHSVNMRCGINFGYPSAAYAIDNLVCMGNKIDEYVTTISGEKAYIFGLNNAIITNVIIKENVPSWTKVSAINMVAGSVAFTGNSSTNMLTTSGTQIITNMYPIWNGREIMITQIDAGTCTFSNADGTNRGFRNNATLAIGESTLVRHDGSKWNIIK